MVTITGMDELRRFLRDLPREMDDEASTIIREAAQVTADRAKAAYPRGDTGNLRRGVRVFHDAGSRGAMGIGARPITSYVRNSAPHSHLFEFGSQLRRHSNGKSVGAMPARPTLIPIAARARSQMFARLIRMVQGKGFQVHGSLGAGSGLL